MIGKQYNVNTVSAISSLHAVLKPFRDQNKKLGFVPTMGSLHEGHLSLIRKAKDDCDVVAVSIFVNPTQFAPNEDFTRYPRDIERDTRLAGSAGCDVLFIPAVEEIYPKDFSSFIEVEGLSSVLEGKFRPTHYKGVCTIVNKLFNIVQPDTAYFGQKDAQQCLVIKKMVRDLNMPVHIEITPTVREADGLAMSSRNVYLNEDERPRASVLFQALKFAEEKIKNGERNVNRILDEMTTMIQSKNPTQIDYITAADSENLQPRQLLEKGETVLFLLAVRFGTTRLIDNSIVTV